ncbi:ubiquinone/menaquinone biosynthesis methyltransferase [Thermoplasmatales archaeon BRNA1]|nr:ubiquinone/menaquinone biosynthesis methyltransferase [Thermoplasmatales archaeon BRNA1]
MSKEEVKPNGTQFEGKEEYVKDVFTQISSFYDEMNDIMSMNMIKGWHKTMIRLAGDISGKTCADIGTGTGKIAFLVAQHAGPEGTVYGIDLTPAMIDYAKEHMPADLPKPVDFRVGNALELELEDCSVDLVTSGYMLRNVTDIQKCLSEMYRVLRPGGKVVVAEMATPDNRVIRYFYNLYMNKRVRRIARKYDKGKQIDGHQAAYDWLADSIKGFPHGRVMADKFSAAGFRNVRFHNKMFGAACIYEGVKE